MNTATETKCIVHVGIAIRLSTRTLGFVSVNRDKATAERDTAERVKLPIGEGFTHWTVITVGAGDWAYALREFLFEKASLVGVDADVFVNTFQAGMLDLLSRERKMAK